jgi:hypothetical protein
MTTLHWSVKNRGRDKAAKHHAPSGGARERWDFVSGPPARAPVSSGAKTRLDACATLLAFTAGGGTAAIAARQPTQQQSTQIWPLVPSAGDAGCAAAALWQMAVPGLAMASAAARAAPKLAIRLDSAIA